MKNKWFNSLGLADEKYVDQANPQQPIRRTSFSKTIKRVVAACACIAIVVVGLWMFLPFNTQPKNISKYKGNDYYSVIEQLNVLTAPKPRYKNNFEKLTLQMRNLFAGAKGEAPMADNATAMAPTAPESANKGDSYQEVTDNQVAGVIEADKIKRTNTHIFYLASNQLMVYDINKEQTQQVGSYMIDVPKGSASYVDSWEFFLSQDGQTVTVLMQGYNATLKHPQVSLLSLDVSDPTSVTKKSQIDVKGGYVSSRLTDGKLLLFANYAVDVANINFDDQSTFLPQINQGNGWESLPASKIVTPKNANSTRYTVALLFDEQNWTLTDSLAYLSYSEKVYVSQNNLYLSFAYYDFTQNDSKTIRNSMTEIACIAYGNDGFAQKGSVVVRGYVKDQYSMDEYNNVLRVVTTTNATDVNMQYQSSSTVSSILTATGKSNASLYCVDLTSFEIVAQVVDFAPWREEVKSARFDKNYAYVCTSIELSDPVFFFDLTDLQNITVKDTGTIEGFSTSLVNFGDGLLLGIGRGNSWSSFKIEIYQETSTGVQSFCSLELDFAEYSTDYKSYYIDRENKLIGLGLNIYNYNNSDIGKYQSNDFSGYVVFHFDGLNVVEVARMQFGGTNKLDVKRGVYIDGYMYAFSEQDFAVVEIGKMI